MKFYRLNLEQRKLWADKLMDLANFSVVGLVFGQIVSETGPDLGIVGFGLLLYIFLTAVANNFRG